jgi:hypothetical protein
LEDVAELPSSSSEGGEEGSSSLATLLIALEAVQLTELLSVDNGLLGTLGGCRTLSATKLLLLVSLGSTLLLFLGDAATPRSLPGVAAAPRSLPGRRRGARAVLDRSRQGRPLLDQRRPLAVEVERGGLDGGVLLGAPGPLRGVAGLALPAGSMMRI